MTEADEQGPGKASAPSLGRRSVLKGALALAVASPFARAATGVPPATLTAVAQITKGSPVSAGRVLLTMPKLAENGRSVPMTIEVESPMSETDYVRTVHVFAGENPTPTIARFHFGPHSGAAYVKTRVRLADTQEVLALAEMSDGSFWSGQAHVVVTLGGCLDPVL